MNGQRMECVPGRGKAVRPLLSVDARHIAFAQNPAAKHLAIGALLAGVIVDFAGLSWAIGSTAILTFLSGLVATLLMSESPGHLNIGREPSPGFPEHAPQNAPQEKQTNDKPADRFETAKR
jgi:hypothetical protein